MIEWAIQHEGPVYIRLTRQGVEELEMDEFKLGFYPELKKGEKIAFLGTGGILNACFMAAKELEQQGVMNPGVYNANVAKPLNKEFMRKLAAEYQTLVVFEDHTTLGGTGSAIAEWMSEFAETPRRVIRYGIKDIFGESATPAAILDRHGLTTEKIVSYFSK
jgi:transketolase